MNPRLSRNPQNAILGGVCSGLGDYLGIDPVIVRIFFIIFALASGVGVLVYVLLWIILPRTDEVNPTGFANANDFGNRARQMGEEFGQAFRRPNPGAAKFIGFALVLAGAVFLLENLHLPWLSWLRSELIWPALLIVGGVALLLRSMRKE